MSIMRYSPGHGLLCALYLHELQRGSPGCCCPETTLAWHLGAVTRGYVTAVPWLHYGYIMAAVTAAASAGREAVLRLPCQPGKKSVSAVPMGPRVIFQPLNLCLAHPGCSKPWEQQDNWHHEQDQQDSYVQEMQQVHLDQSKDFS